MENRKTTQEINDELKNIFKNPSKHYQTKYGNAIQIVALFVEAAELPPVQSALLFNVLKYLIRFNKKGGVDDLVKAIHYIQFLIEDCDINEK
jgi:hypothetical protein